MRPLRACNLVQLGGELVEPPAFRKTQRGETLCLLKLRVTESWAEGGATNLRESVHHFTVLLSGQAHIDLAHEQLEQGSWVQLTGRLYKQKLTPARGVERWVTNIEVPDSGKLERIAADELE